jgi:hypothetical protein
MAVVTIALSEVSAIDNMNDYLAKWEDGSKKLDGAGLTDNEKALAKCARAMPSESELGKMIHDVFGE